MLLLNIFLLLITLSSIYGPLHAAKTSNDLQEEGKQGNTWDTNRINVSSRKTKFATFRTEKNAGNTTGQTLEGCFGGLGRMLSFSSGKKKDMEEKRKCYCRCYRRLSQKEASKISQKEAAKLEGYCSHIEAGGCDGCTSINSNGGTTKMIESTAEELKVSSRRLATAPTETRLETALDPGHNADTGNVQHHDGQGKKRQIKGKSRTYRTPAGGREQCCCDKMCENCCEPYFLAVFGLPLLCMVESCNWCCDRLFRCLAKICPC